MKIAFDHKPLGEKSLTGGVQVLAAVFLGWLSAVPALAQGPGPNRVEAVPAVEREVAPTIRLVGTVRPRVQTTVASEVSGRVAELPVDEGDFVAKGALLCKLRDAPRRFSHDEAVARLSELQAGLAVARAGLKKAEFEKNRTERLWKKQQSTDKERTDTLADFVAAKAAVDQARFAVDAQKAVVDRLADALAQTEIHAPFSGYVVAKRTEVGAWVQQGGGIVDLLDLSVARIRINVPESYIPFCQIGAEARVTIEALDKSFAGRISRVVPNADAQARTFPVDIDIPNKTAQLKAGMFVRAMVPSGPKGRHLLIPKDAVVMRGPMPMIFVVRRSKEGQMADMLPVKVLDEVLDAVAVRARGLAAGDWVVVRGNERMRGPGPVIATLRKVPTRLKPDSIAGRGEKPSLALGTDKKGDREGANDHGGDDQKKNEPIDARHSAKGSRAKGVLSGPAGQQDTRIRPTSRPSGEG